MLIPRKEAQQKSEKTLNKDVNIDLLTPKEKEVLLLVAQGASNQEIADKLFVRDVTIKTHLNSILTYERQTYNHRLRHTTQTALCEGGS